MKLRLPVAVSLFVLGAVAGLIGDHGHVVTNTTEYLSFSVPFVWSSPFWFPIMVGLATVTLAELRLHLPEQRTGVTARQGAAGVAAVIGLYTVTALVHTAPVMPALVLIWALAVITWCALGDSYGAICGALAAVVGPAVEAVIVAAGLFRYTEGSDGLLGVAPWLTGLYFAFGVVVALLAEVSVAKHVAPSYT